MSGPRAMFCSGCGGWADDWTPGCSACRERLRKRALRSGDPDLIRRYRLLARERRETADQEHARKQRDGELEPWWLEQRRGTRGRWVAA